MSSQSPLLSLSAWLEHTVSLVVLDYYMSAPHASMDCTEGITPPRRLLQVPVLRVFGALAGPDCAGGIATGGAQGGVPNEATSNREHRDGGSSRKACVHIHNVFPYIYVPNVLSLVATNTNTSIPNTSTVIPNIGTSIADTSTNANNSIFPTGTGGPSGAASCSQGRHAVTQAHLDAFAESIDAALNAALDRDQQQQARGNARPGYEMRTHPSQHVFKIVPVLAKYVLLLSLVKYSRKSARRRLAESLPETYIIHGAD